MFEYSEEDGRYVAMHHPFTAPKDEDFYLLDIDPTKMRAKAYDIVINGQEAGGGSIRIHSSDLQEKMFEALGFTKEEANDRFGHMIEAFSYGAPPHGGLAFGLDRLVMLLAKTDNIRDVIAFPKVQNASEIMMASPDFVEDVQLTDLHIAVCGKEE
jgi:aspartyl-tRNA synthetase